MARADLEKSWAITVQHLEAARALISAGAAPGPDGGTLARYEEFLEHNELELALDELADVGDGNSPPAQFWRKLGLAAENMGLTQHAAKFERKLGRREAQQRVGDRRLRCCAPSSRLLQRATTRTLGLMVDVRPFLESDRLALEVIYRDCRMEAAWLPPAVRERSHFARDTEGEAILVAVGSTYEAEGFISVWVPESFIHHLYVRSSARGRGVGERLLDSLNGRIPKPWRMKCLRANAEAFRFYLKRGWKEVASGTSEDGPFATLEKI
jgi:GNAT superfamily N-acetyltransferase